MKICPKCGGFFDDELLRFCLNDGTPLLPVNETDENWTKGLRSIKETKRIIQKETRKRQFRKLVWMLITTVLVIMVISVITLNSWIYFNNPEDEQKEITKEIPVVETTPTPEPQLTIVESLTPTETPTPSPTKTPTPSLTPTKTPTPSPTPSPKPDCSLEKQKQFENTIENQYAKVWKDNFEKGGKNFLSSQRSNFLASCNTQITDSQACVRIFDASNITMSDSPVRKSIKADKQCKSVSVSITYNWTITAPQLRPLTYPQTKPFKYPIK